MFHKRVRMPCVEGGALKAIDTRHACHKHYFCSFSNILEQVHKRYRSSVRHGQVCVEPARGAVSARKAGQRPILHIRKWLLATWQVYVQSASNGNTRKPSLNWKSEKILIFYWGRITTRRDLHHVFPLVQCKSIQSHLIIIKYFSRCLFKTIVNT